MDGTEVTQTERTHAKTQSDNLRNLFPMATQETVNKTTRKQNPKMPILDWFGMGRVPVAADRVSIYLSLSLLLASPADRPD